MFLFTDGSVNTKTKIGCGAYLLINELEFSADLKDMVKINVFNNTSSSSLEVETLLWALKEINIFNQT
ncbi:MAG: hypothetical protein K9L78_05260, partial [Victivallales bacterium]|nr:hypothetical protein [Victivallales bacterium]